MQEFDVVCPQCGALSNATQWLCDAVEHRCKCPKCESVCETSEVFGMWHRTEGPDSMPFSPIGVRSSALNEW
jgi:hypothetical protein